MTDTPLTDAAVDIPADCDTCVNIEFARQLERDRARLMEALDRLADVCAVFIGDPRWEGTPEWEDLKFAETLLKELQ